MYGYRSLVKDLALMQGVFSIGKSVLDREIWCIKLGSGYPCVIVQGGIHGREWITSPLLIRLAKRLKPTCTFYIIPMVNPDGVEIATGGYSTCGIFREAVERLSGDHLTYKANARGVDLNVNFNYLWGLGKNNVYHPSSENYVSEYFESEPETVALTEFTRKVKPVVSLSYHSKGEVIYWSHDSVYERRAYPFAREYALSTGYSLMRSDDSTGGYRDWFIDQRFGLGLTFEVGSDDLTHPIGMEYLDGIVKRNEEVLSIADRQARIIFGRRIYEGRTL